MKLGAFAAIITSTFTDEMDIYRYQDVENKDGSTDTKLSDVPIYAQVPCKVSFASDESPKDKEVDSVPLKLIPKIFCKVDEDIEAGDFIVVRRFSDNGKLLATYSGKVGLPSVFYSHKEALFSIERSA